MAHIVTRKMRIKDVAKRLQAGLYYTPYWTKGWPHLNPQLPPARETYERLMELGSDPDPDAVDAITGRSDSMGLCDECGEEVATAAVFDVNGDEFEVSICAACCRDLAGAIDAANHTTQTPERKMTDERPHRHGPRIDDG